MKQTTLATTKKRSVTSTVTSASKRRGGTANEPITLELEEEETIVIEEDEEVEDVKEPVAGPSTALSTRHAGPSTAHPLRINDPDFDVTAIISNVEPTVIRKEPELDLLYFKTLIKGRQLFEYLLNELPWYRVIYQTRGITIRTPRWTCVWGCDETGASLSIYKIKPRPIPNALQTLKQHMEEKTGAKYNFVLVNYYENGKDSISWHSDDESFLGPLPCIASLSLGSSRDFQMKHKEDKSAKVEKWSLQSGDCVVMRGTTQSRWLHSVPKRANAGGRMNLTFRRAMNTAGTNNYYRYNVYTGDVHRWKNGRMVAVP